LVGGHIFFEYYFEKSILNHQNCWGSSIFEGHHKIKKKRKNRFWIFKKGFLNKKGENKKVTIKCFALLCEGHLFFLWIVGGLVDWVANLVE
jgi:hypothetical protein